ncbi:cytochrome c oxidase subunit I [Natronomonas amylolytica]|uniref:cytochrome c oxidase subunit I n=1 Tax=Natronomonas amylolytica TaxID=3108498 RepID=UPI003008AA42
MAEHDVSVEDAHAENDSGHDDHGPTGWRYWLYTTDHKVIGIIYLWHALFFFALGGTLALIFRTDLAMGPDSVFLNPAGYNSLISVHAITMIFFVILPLSGAFANYLIPLMVGADEMAYPRMNALGAWGIGAGGLLVWLPFLTNALGLTGLPTNAGWFQYPPLNSMLNTVGTDLAILGVAVFGITSTGSAINFLVTVLNERRNDMGWFDIPIFIWAIGVFTSILALYSLPWLLSAWGMTFLERNLGMVFFTARAGGDPLLYQWVFWTFGHPEVYVLVLPGMGIAVEVISRFSERPIFGYKAILGSFIALTVLSVGVWAHHMFASGIAASRYAFMVFSMGIAVAFGIYLFATIATMWRGRIHLTTPMLFSIGVLVGLVYSGMEGIMLGQPVMDLELHSTYFVVAHFHFTLFMVGVFGLIAGIYYWYPKMTGRMYNSTLAKFHAATTIGGVPLLFFAIGILGEQEVPMMRRYATYTYAPGLQQLHILATVLAFVVAIGQAAFLINLLWSLRAGDRVEHPWEELFGERGMSSPEWDGFPYRPPTPAVVTSHRDATADGGTTDEDVQTASDGGKPEEATADSDRSDESGGESR